MLDDHVLPLVETPIVASNLNALHSSIWYKRDDLLPFSFGGNKVRIADAYLSDALGQGATSIIAYGNARSNLCRVLANACASLRLPCTIISPADDDGTRHVTANALMVEGLGGEIVPCVKAAVKPVVEEVLALHEQRGLKPYYIYGNSDGTGRVDIPVRAYDRVVDEILAWQNRSGIMFNSIVLALGTGMTMAGLLAGLMRHGLANTQVIGISTARPAESAKQWVARYLKAYAQEELPEAMCSVRDEWVGNGYGSYDTEMIDDARMVAAVDGVGLDMTYTGKAFHGMLQMLRADEDLGENVLFLHTGGTPLFFDSVAEIMGGTDGHV